MESKSNRELLANDGIKSLLYEDAFSKIIVKVNQMADSNLILNRIFSRNLLRALLCQKNDAKRVYRAVLNKYLDSFENKTNKELIEEIYQTLEKKYRNEYFYKNVLLEQLVFKFHHPETTIALTEIPVSKSIADFILINGKATVYEIKTDLDNFDRLDSQLINYYKAFDNVCVVVSESNLPLIKKKLLNKKIGICYISKQGDLESYRKPKSHKKQLDLEIMFKILRKYEYEGIISKYYVLPNVSQFKYYKACKRLFRKIPLNRVYKDFKDQLKQRNQTDIDLMSSLPKALTSVVYFSGFKTKEFSILRKFLEKKYGG